MLHKISRNIAYDGSNKDKDLPLEASDISQGNSHKSKEQEDPHVGSEAPLATRQSF